MNIYTKEGGKVTVTETTINYGHRHDKEQVNKYLKINEIYTIDHTEVYSWHTDVYLKEFPNISFNSVHFKDIIENNIHSTKT